MYKKKKKKASKASFSKYYNQKLEVKFNGK